MKAVIVDIDGTVAKMDGQRGPYEYDKVHLDKPNENVVELVKVLRSAGYRIIFLSGREETCWAETTAWLARYVTPSGDPLYMRAAKDYRDDTIVKREMYEKRIKPYYDVLFALDDRNKVVAMWREIGLTCLQVAPGDF